VVINEGARFNTIGGTAPGAGNTISGNTNYGVWITSRGSGATSNLVQGNRIGTNAAGTAALANLDGVVIDGGASYNTIGGTAPGAGNTISGNTDYGVWVTLSGTTGNLVQGNRIGTNASTAALPNGTGVEIDDGASGNTIGGTAAGAGNTIAYNRSDGIHISSGIYSSSAGNAILGNSIHDNGGLGIHLASGANDNQVAPVLTSARFLIRSTRISGTLASVANTTFRIEFFSNQSPNPSGYGEGLTLLGSLQVTTDATGNASFTATGLPSLQTGQHYLSATATVANSDGSFGDTSQFGTLPPTAHLTSSTVSSPAGHPATVGFTLTTAAGFSSIVNWGDGNSNTIPPGSSMMVSHSYAAAGLYTVTLTATDRNGGMSQAATALVVVSTAANDQISLSGGSSAGQVAVSTKDEGAFTTVGTPDQVVVAGSSGSDTYRVNFGSTLTTPITVTGGGATSGDTLVVNGDSSSTNVINKTPGQITWGSPVTETVYRSGIPNTTINAQGTTTNYVNDPGGSTIINGGPGTNFITVTATTGSGVVIHGGPATNNFIIDLGSLAAPVNIQNSNAGATDSLVVNGAAGDNTITVAGTQVTEGTQTISHTAPLANLTINGGSGNNQITVASLGVPVQHLNLNGGPGNDTLTVAAGVTVPATLTAGSGGNDLLQGGGGSTTSVGSPGGGTTTYVVSAGTANIVAGTGDNVLIVTGGKVASITAPPGVTVPIVFADSYTVLDNGVLAVSGSGVLANDLATVPGGLTAVLDRGPARGTLALNAGGSFTYTPAANYVGPDTFIYLAEGGNGALSSPAVVMIQVEYDFSGFLPPLGNGVTFAVNRTIPIKFRLSDAGGNPITSPNAVTSLLVTPVVNGVAGTPFVPASTNGQGLQSAGGQYLFNWQTKGLAAGTYAILLTLSDGRTYTQTIQLTASGNGADAQAVDGSGVRGGRAAGQFLGGDLALWLNEPSGPFAADQRIPGSHQDGCTLAATTAPWSLNGAALGVAISQWLLGLPAWASAEPMAHSAGSADTLAPEMHLADPLFDQLFDELRALG
jgi:hypothetical protein